MGLSGTHRNASDSRKFCLNLTGFCAVDYYPITPELNPSAQRCMTRLFTGELASWAVHFVNIYVKNQQIHQLFLRFLCLLRVAQLRNSRWNIVDGRFESSDVMHTEYHVTRHNTLIHNNLSTAPQFSISQKALGTLPHDGNVMSKHVGATIHN
jgi:hypothetical protein